MTENDETITATEEEDFTISNMMAAVDPGVGGDDTTASGEGAAAGEVVTTAGEGDDEARFNAWYAKVHPEAPEGISKLDNWKQVRQAKEAVTKSLWKAEQSLQEREKSIASLKAELDELRGKGGALPESEAVERLQAELAAERQAKAQELAEWQAHKSKQELEGNHAFLAEFDGKRARIEDEVREVVKEAGLGDEVAVAVLAAGSRY
jgi:chromosome segregation ATPase